MDFPSPRSVQTYYSNDPNDPYRRPPSRRNRYSRPGQQTPRVRDVTWISSPDAIAPRYAPPSPWIPPVSQAPLSPMQRPPSAFPSPAPTVGERMALDELTLVQDELVDIDPYQRPHRPGLVKSLWKGLKKLTGFRPAPSFPIPRPVSRPSSYGSHMMRVPMPQPSAPSEYVDPTPPESGTGTGTGTEERRGPSPYASPYVRSARVTAAPAIIPDSLRVSPVLVHSPVPAPSLDIAPPVTIISPSIPPSPRPSVRSIRPPRSATPGPAPRTLSAQALEPEDSIEEASQTLHEPVLPDPVIPAGGVIPVVRSDDDKSPTTPVGDGAGVLFQTPEADRSYSNGSLASTMARVRRFVAELDSLPWVSDEQIADEYVPEKNPRSRMRRKVRQGAEPSWYNPRPEVVERPAYWSEWDMWAKQSTAALWGGTVGVNGGRAGRMGWAGVGAHGGVEPGPRPAPWGPVYPRGYAMAQPAFVYPFGYPPPGPPNGQLL